MLEPSKRPEPGAQQDSRAEIRRLIQESEAAQDAPALAMEICQRAVFLAERAGSDFEIELADSLRQRGILYSLISDYDAALKDYAQTYMIYDGHGDQKGIAILYDLTSVIFAAVGLYPEALQGFLTSYEYFRHDEDPTWKVQLLNNIGYAYLLLKDPGAGMPYMEECLRMLDANHQRKILASTLDSLAHAYRMIGDHNRALETILKAVQAGRDNNSNFEIAECLCGAGKIYQAMGQAELAISSLEQAVQIAKESGFRRIEAEALFILGESLIQLGQFEHSLESAQRSLAIAQETGLQPLVYNCFRLLGEICKRNGDFESALKFYEQLISVSEEISRYQSRMRLHIMEASREVERVRRDNYLERAKNSALQVEIEKRKQAQSVAEHLAITDPLTGMFNRRHFFELARQELARVERYNHPMALIMLDIDHFKQVNDTFGHITGDEVLIMGSRLIRATLREGDVVGRYGGEEFVILLPDTELDQARLAAERLREMIASQNLETDKGPVSVTISIGIASTSHAGSDETLSLEKLLTWADDALYHAKHSGRNRIAVYQPGLESAQAIHPPPGPPAPDQP